MRRFGSSLALEVNTRVSYQLTSLVDNVVVASIGPVYLEKYESPSPYSGRSQLMMMTIERSNRTKTHQLLGRFIIVGLVVTKMVYSSKTLTI